jgi:hypothetical protein
MMVAIQQSGFGKILIITGFNEILLLVSFETIFQSGYSLFGGSPNDVKQT